MDYANLLSVEPGTLISVPTHVVYRHVGIVSDLRDLDGLPLIISNSPYAGGVIEERFVEFTKNRPWHVRGYPGQLSPMQVLYRARTCQHIGYNALTWNCENFVNYCHGLPETSGQAAATLMLALAGVILFSAAKA